MWLLVSFIKRSVVRRKVLESVEIVRTPTEVARFVGIHDSAASRALLELTGKGLIECLTPSEKHGRLYRITRKGKLILNKV